MTNNKPDFIKWLLWGGAVATVAVLVLLFVNRRHWFHPNPKINLADYPVRGIDVSNHNGVVDWPKVSAAGYRFAFVKASEGKAHRDNAFARNVSRARRAGLLVGAYHFFRKNREGGDQAANFLQAIDGHALDLPLVIDIEDWDNARGQDETLVQQRFRDMIRALEHAGHRVMIYTNGDGYSKYYKPNCEGHDLWLCSFRTPDALSRTHRHSIQQYSHWGEVPGVKGDVDLNIFIGSEKQWDEWLHSNSLRQ